MKTPKAKVDNKKNKFNAPLDGKVKKSFGKKATNISLKNAEKALNTIISDDPSEIKVKNKKALLNDVSKNQVKAVSKPQRGSPALNKKAQNGIKPQGNSPNQPKKGKGKAKNVQVTPDSTSDLGDIKESEKLTTEGQQKKKSKKQPKTKGGANNASPDSENNSSPVKINMETKKGKTTLAFDLSDSLATTPNKKSPRGKGGKTGPGKLENSSPEVELGLKLEEALSPKSKKEKKKRAIKGKLQAEGKVEVSKEASPKALEPSAGGESPLKKRKKRRGKKKKNATGTEPREESLFQAVNAKNALSALLKTLNTGKSKKKELFDEEQFILLQVNLLKSSELAKGVLHIAVPHLILPGEPDVCLITPDLKGKRNDPEEAIDFYKDLLKEKNIDFISEIIPIRKLKKEYSQFEERTKLANRFDAILVDGRVNKMARIGRRFAKSKKCVSAVKFDAKDLKAEFERGLRKVALFSSGKGNSYAIKCGRVGMDENDICENIIAIGKALANDRIIIGDKKNVSSVFVKTGTSNAFPLYVSTVSPNEVAEPKGKLRIVEKPVRGEVTTVEGADVVVYPSGAVKLKKRKNEAEESDEEDKSASAKNKAKKAKATPKDSKKPANKLEEIDDEYDSDDIPSDGEESFIESVSGEEEIVDFFNNSENDTDFEIDEDDDFEIGNDDDSESEDDEKSDIEDAENDNDDDVSDSDEEKEEIKLPPKKAPVASPKGQKKNAKLPAKTPPVTTPEGQKRKRSKRNKGKGASPNALQGKGIASQNGSKAPPKRGPPQNSPKPPQKKKGAQNSPKQLQNKNAAGAKKQAFNNKGKNANKFKGKGKAQ